MTTEPARPSTSESIRVEALFRALRTLSADLETGELVRATLHAATSLFHTRQASAWVRTAGKLALQLTGTEGLEEPLLDGVEMVGRTGGLVDMASLADGQPRVILCAERKDGLVDVYAASGVGEVLVLPLVVNGEVVGAILLYSSINHTWSKADRELGALFARQLGSIVSGSLLLADARSDAARLKAVQELSWRLNRIQGVDAIGEAIVAEADKLIAHDTIRVYRVDTTRGMCEPIAFQGEFLGIGRPSIDQLRVPIGTGITGWVAAHNQAVRLADARRDSRGQQVGNPRGAESMLAVPMAWESSVLGVIVVSRDGYDHFSDGDQRMLEVFAGYAAQSIVSAEAFAELEQQRLELANRLERQHRLLEISERLLATLEPTSVLDQIADSLGALIAFDSLAIFRLDHAGGVRRALVVRDPDADAIREHTPPIDAGINGWALAHGEAVLANDAQDDPRAIQIPGTPVSPESLIVCPLMADGVAVGTLNVARMGADRRRFSADEFELARLFATQASIAMRNAETHGAAVVAAEHDPLTGLRNQGSFEHDLASTVARSQPFALLELDLDHFKSFNDPPYGLGHPAGDALLQRIATALRDTVRGSDLVYRTGGDEFWLIVPGANRATAEEIAGRIKAAVLRAGVADAPVVSASVGIAIYPDDAATTAALQARADEAMYAVKNAKR